jgi:hypothetical protein
MTKKIGILFCLLALIFQVLIYNVFLFGVILFAKLDDSGYTEQITMSVDQYAKLNWHNEHEFSINSFLFDAKELKKTKDHVTLVYKIDVKEKNSLEKLLEDFKRSKNKKIAFFAGVYNISEPYELTFVTDNKKTFFTEPLVSINEPAIEKTSPPPKA